MPHTLAVVDVLIAAERLTQASDTISLTTLHLERDLRRCRLRVTVPAAGARLQERRVTVVPDALFSLDVAGNRLDFVVELDRGTERREKWRDKVAALTTWITTPQSRTLLPGRRSSATVMVVTESPGRREQLRVWTEEELCSMGFLRDYGRIFAISCASPVSLSPEAFFAQPHWWPVFSQVPKSLIKK